MDGASCEREKQPATASKHKDNTDKRICLFRIVPFPHSVNINVLVMSLGGKKYAPTNLLQRQGNNLIVR